MRRIHRSLLLILIIAVSAIIWDYHSRNLGTSLLFKSSDFPYGIQPRLYGKELQLFTTAENCIIIGNYKGQKIKNRNNKTSNDHLINQKRNASGSEHSFFRIWNSFILISGTHKSRHYADAGCAAVKCGLHIFIVYTAYRVDRDFNIWNYIC